MVDNSVAYYSYDPVTFRSALLHSKPTSQKTSVVDFTKISKTATGMSASCNYVHVISIY